MSIKTSPVRRTTGGDPKVTITLVGHYEIIRFADRMLEWQCEFGDAGRKILRGHRRFMGGPAFARFALYLGLPHAWVGSRRLRKEEW